MAPNLKPDAPTDYVTCCRPECDDTETVECEVCRLWARCAGVTGKDEVFCPLCTQSQVPKMRKNARKPRSDAGTSGAVQLPKDVQDQRELEVAKEEKKMAELIRKKQMEMEKMYDEKQLRIEREMQEMELAVANELRTMKLKLEKEFHDKKLAAEQEFLAKQKKMEERIRKSSVFEGNRIKEEQEKTLLVDEDGVEMDVIEKESAEEATGLISLEVL